MSHESLTLVAEHFNIADVSALYAAVGEGNLSAQAVVKRVIELHGGNDGAQEDLAEAVTITGRRSRAAGRRRQRRGRHRQGRLGRLGQARQVLHPGAARRDPRLRHQGRGSLGAPHRLHQRRRRCAAQPEKLVEVEWAPTSDVDVPGQHPGRGARPGPPALRHHDGALRRPREHPQRQPLHHPRPGRQEPLHASRWPRPSTSTPSSRRSAAYPASSTPTASPSSPFRESALVVRRVGADGRESALVVARVGAGARVGAMVARVGAHGGVRLDSSGQRSRLDRQKSRFNDEPPDPSGAGGFRRRAGQPE